ncbi:MAG: hypothetical protein AAF990_17325 [Bacteroidota bacterium]
MKFNNAPFLFSSCHSHPANEQARPSKHWTRRGISKYLIFIRLLFDTYRSPHLGLVIFILFCTRPGLSQTEFVLPMDAETWEVQGEEHRWTDYKGQRSLYLKEGRATVPDVQLQDGIIDFDIAFPQARMFVGIQFRQQDAYNYEEFYIRPHQSGKPDAMQYSPVYNGATGWQLYNGQGHWANYDYSFDNWTHVRIILAGQQMELYIDDMEKPVLYNQALKRPQKAGYLAVRSSMGGAYYANFRYQKIDNPKITSPNIAAPTAEAGSIQQWQVSSTFPDSLLGDGHQIPASLKKSLRWKGFATETSGLLNIARNDSVSELRNTVFAKVVLKSEKEQIQRFDFGYSDQVIVFLNGKAIYGGQYIFRSRDYRFLGSIGYFDTLFLPLQKGRNELWIAVTENFGGWGFQGRLPQLKDLQIE